MQTRGEMSNTLGSGKKPINNKMKLEIDTADLTIPLRYYKGWTIEFSTKTEKFNSPILCLFGFSSVCDLEKAIDYALEQRNK